MVGVWILIGDFGLWCCAFCDWGSKAWDVGFGLFWCFGLWVALVFLPLGLILVVFRWFGLGWAVISVFLCCCVLPSGFGVGL